MLENFETANYSKNSMFADDDALMLPDNVQRVIMKTIEQEKNSSAVFAIAGCGGAQLEAEGIS